MRLDDETAGLDRERLGKVWAAFGCAQNPDDFKESVREQMWSQVLDMARESAQQSGRLYRENERLIEEIRRLRGGVTEPVDRGARVVVSEYGVVHECGLDLATGDPVEAEELKRNHRCPPQAPTPASATDTSE